MSNLKELDWSGYGYSDGTVYDTVTPICEYDVMPQKEGGYTVNYYNRQTEEPTKEATGFSTIADAKEWCWNHYNEKMQPYVKPSHAWIDASKQLPDSEGFYMVYVFDGHRDENVTDILYWNPDHQQFLEWDFMNNVTHWMPLPDAPKEISND